MADDFQQARDNLVQSLGQVAESAGFNRMIGQIYALLYLSPVQLSLGEIADKLNVSKGSVSLNTQNMERWGMIKRINRPADRRDYYEPNIDFWDVIRGILSNREKKVISELKSSLADIIVNIKKSGAGKEAKFYRERFQHMLDFTNTFLRLFNAYMAMENFKSSALGEGNGD
jgi:DNA-binding transcriptional regulator GbsR (MarR family)